MAGMDFAAELKQRLERGGITRAVLARRAGYTPQYISQLVEGQIKRIPPATERAIREALAALADGAAGRDLRPSHPGVAALAADAELVAALGATPEELAALGSLYIEWQGRPVVLRDKLAAAEALRLMREGE